MQLIVPCDIVNFWELADYLKNNCRRGYHNELLFNANSYKKLEEHIKDCNRSPKLLHHWLNYHLYPKVTVIK